MEMHEIRVKNLRRLISEQYGGKHTGLADAVGISLSQIGQWLSGERNMSERSARRIEKATGKPIGWLDSQHQATDARHQPPPVSGLIWPFSFSLERFMGLSEISRGRIDGYISRMIEEEERKNYESAAIEANDYSHA